MEDPCVQRHSDLPGNAIDDTDGGVLVGRKISGTDVAVDGK
jgi:hypothetical protein